MTEGLKCRAHSPWDQRSILGKVCIFVYRARGKLKIHAFTLRCERSGEVVSVLSKQLPTTPGNGIMQNCLSGSTNIHVLDKHFDQNYWLQVVRD